MKRVTASCDRPYDMAAIFGRGSETSLVIDLKQGSARGSSVCVEHGVRDNNRVCHAQRCVQDNKRVVGRRGSDIYMHTYAQRHDCILTFASFLDASPKMEDGRINFMAHYDPRPFYDTRIVRQKRLARASALTQAGSGQQQYQ